MKKFNQKSTFWTSRSTFKFLLIMKLTFLLTLFFTFAVSASTYSQNTRLSISKNNVTFKEILTEIEENSEFIFLYESETIENNEKRSVDVKNETVDHILDILFSETDIKYEINDRQIALFKEEAEILQEASGSDAEQKTTKLITGKVTDESNYLIPGVSIVVKGTKIGTVTNIDGNYTLEVPSGATTLIFSFVGMKTIEVPIDGAVVDVVMKPDMIGVDEVMVVAYGTAKKESVTGAISAIDSKSIKSRPVSSVAGVIEGMASGVQVNNTYGEPGSNPTIRIRGFSTVNGSNAPLYIIDGVVFGGSISDLNPNDIESMSVLKDAASAALYGNKASNGVILITTKKGKKGKTEGVSISASINQGLYTRGMKEYERVGPDDYMEIMWKGYRNSLMTSQPGDYENETDAGAEASNTLISTYLLYNIYNKDDDALFDSDGKLVSDAAVRSGYDDLDWFKYIERLGHRQDYNVSGEGSSEKSNYMFSAGYTDEKGYLKSSDFKRFTGRSSINITPKEWINAGLTLSGSHQISNNSTGGSGNSSSYINPFNYARHMSPIYPVYLHDMSTGEYLLDDEGNKQYDSGSEYSRPQNLDRHIVWETELNMDRTYKNTLQSQAYTHINFLKDFTISITGDINVRNTERQTYNNATIGDGAGNGGRASRRMYRYKNYTFQQQLTWDKNLEGHHVDVLAGHENYSNSYSYTYGYKTTETFEGGTELINFTDITTLTGYENNYRTESYLSRLRYNYNNKYYFDASFRRDGSSRFYKDNRWGNFWSVGSSWTISKESFMSPYQDVVNFLKLRASYGEVGNDQSVGYYAYMALYDLDQNANVSAVYKSQNEALDIQWETSSSFGIALEGTYFNRAKLTLEYFDKRSKDLLFDVNLPLSAGATSTSSAEATITQNLGSVSNRGLEVEFNIDLIQNRDLRWNVGFNATIIKNKIVTLPEENRENGIISGTKKYMEGHGIYDFWMYQYAGVDQMTGRALYLPNLDDYYAGESTSDDRTEIPDEYLVQVGDEYYTTYTTYAKKDWSGSAMPDVYGSFSSKVDYKNFQLSTLFTYSLGGKTLDYSYQNLMGVTANPSAIHVDVLKAWDGIPDGMTEDSENRIDPDGVPISDYTLSTYSNATSTRFLLDGSYLVIKNIALSYNFPKSITDKLDISNLSVNASVENLATFTKLQGMNPQQSFSGTNYNAFVTARVFSLGVNIKL